MASSLFESYTSGMDNQDQLSAAARYLAQSFTPAVSHTITSIKIQGSKSGTGSPTMTIYWNVYLADANGKPTGAALCSGSCLGSAFSTYSAFSVAEITLGAGSLLTASAKYIIVANCPEATGSKVIYWKMDATSPAYAGGNHLVSTDSGATWTLSTAKDFYFEDWGTLAPITLTPSGIAQAQAVGTPKLTLVLSPTGLSQAIAYGAPVVEIIIIPVYPAPIRKVLITHPALKTVTVVKNGETQASYENLSNLDESRIEGSIELPVSPPAKLLVETLSGEIFTFDIPT